MNAHFVPHTTVTSVVSNPVTASENVNVYTTSPPAIFAVPASSSVIATVGAVVSVTKVVPVGAQAGSLVDTLFTEESETVAVPSI